MPVTKNVKVASLKLDLNNYRTVHQRSETKAVNALIAISPDRFWALMESLLEDGYLPTENVIVLKKGKTNSVKEGNRRVASLKIAHGLIKKIEVPDNIQDAIEKLPDRWFKENESVPCAVYPASKEELVSKIVSRTHAKGEASGRDGWSSVARARYGRDQNSASEPGLDLLEKYLVKGKNLTAAQADRWSGDYPLTVIDEAIKRLASLLDLPGATSVSAIYPKRHKRLLDQISHDVGVSKLGFKQLRNTSEPWQVKYGIELPDGGGGASNDGGGGSGKGSGDGDGGASGAKSSSANDSNKGAGRGKGIAPRSTDPRAVKKLIRGFKPRGKGREKVATLLAELARIDLTKNPHAFCFVLRSIFEISAKAYCDDHKRSQGPSYKRSNGQDKSLVDVLRGVASHLTKGKKDKAKLKRIHGAMAELAKSDGILSVTSMNQLVHHPTFSVIPPDICILFGNLFPFLEDMNS